MVEMGFKEPIAQKALQTLEYPTVEGALKWIDENREKLNEIPMEEEEVSAVDNLTSNNDIKHFLLENMLFYHGFEDKVFC